jgi:FkbM family methyltransferase
VLPSEAASVLAYALKGLRDLEQTLRLARLRGRVWGKEAGSLVHVLGYRLRINDGPNTFMLCKDIFARRIYHFAASRADPYVIDCGSNIGMSILYFKHVYPRARVVGFEPDPVVFPFLQSNVATNALDSVTLVQAAVGNQEGALSFHSDGKYASYLAQPDSVPPVGWQMYTVPCVRLRDYLTEPVDFLKMNIEGSEWETLADCVGRLGYVREMAIEYHHLPGLARSLPRILDLLQAEGFEYLIYDFDGEANPDIQPPFQVGPETRYVLLIYARNGTWRPPPMASLQSRELRARNRGTGKRRMWPGSDRRQRKEETKRA